MKSFFEVLNRIFKALTLANAGNLRALNQLLDQHQDPKQVTQEIKEVNSHLPREGRTVPVRLQIVK
jgi:hypothetical protein